MQSRQQPIADSQSGGIKWITGGNGRSNTKDHQDRGVSLVSQHKGATDHGSEPVSQLKDHPEVEVIQDEDIMYIY